jgi:MFS family permease
MPTFGDAKKTASLSNKKEKHMKELSHKQLLWSFRWLQFETVVTSLTGIVMPVINLLFLDLGLSQAQVGLSQAIFMATALLLDVPTGWLADRFSRRAANMIGDVVAVLGFVLYIFAGSFAAIIFAEILIGIGIAFTNGADVALLKSHAEKLGKDYSKVSARINTIKPIMGILAALIGGWLGTMNIRWPFVANAAFFVVGIIASLFIREIGVRRVTERHPLKDMYNITKYALHGHKNLSWRIIASAFAGNTTHTVVLLLTPLFLLAGYGSSLLGVAWAVMWLGTALGAAVAGRYGKRYGARTTVVAPAVIVVVCYGILAITINKWSVWLYAVFGAAFGWNISLMSPLVQQKTPADIQSTVISVASMLQRLMYIPLVYIINLFGNSNLRAAMLGSAIIYGVMTLILYFGLRNDNDVA